MAIRWIERPAHVESTSDPPSQTRKYRLIGTISENTARANAMALSGAIVTSTVYGTLYRGDIRLSQFDYNSWDVDIPYTAIKRAVGEWTFSFDTTGGTVHISNSKETIRKYRRSGTTGTIPTTGGAIDVQPDEVKGADIVIPTMKINVSYKHPSGVVTPAYARYIHSITGLVNSTPFLGWPAGEILFLGGSGSDGTNTDATVEYQFAASQGTTSLNIGGLSWLNEASAASNIVKEGWNLVWISYESSVDANNPVHKPKYVYIERVYDTIDLATALGFGY